MTDGKAFVESEILISGMLYPAEILTTPSLQVNQDVIRVHGT